MDSLFRDDTTPKPKTEAIREYLTERGYTVDVTKNAENVDTILFPEGTDVRVATWAMWEAYTLAGPFTDPETPTLYSVVGREAKEGD